MERWPHICHVKITFALFLPTNRLVSTTSNSTKYLVYWIPIHVCSRNAQPLLKCAAWIVTFTNQPCRTYEWLVSHTWLDSHMTWLTRDMTHLRMSFDPFVHVTIRVMHVQDSCEKSKQFLLSLSVVNRGNWLLVWFQIISILTCNFKWYLQAPQFGNSTPPHSLFFIL